MGKCVRCGKKAGFFNSYCKDEEQWMYGDILEVVSGFYKGQLGRLIAEYDCGWKKTSDYKIQLNDGMIVDHLDESEVKKISPAKEPRE